MNRKVFCMFVGTLILFMFMLVLSGCSSSKEYDEAIDLAFKEVQKHNDDDGFSYNYSGRDDSNVYVYTLDDYEDSGYIIRCHVKTKSLDSGNEYYDDKWVVLDDSTGDVKSGDPDESQMDQLNLKYEEKNIDN